MSKKDYRTLLGFTQPWFDLGILTEESLELYGTAYESSDDKGTEHYRYGAFRWYLQEHRPLPASMAEALYALGELDADSPMGEAMMANIVELRECPHSVSAKALLSGRTYLVKEVKRRQLLCELHPSSITIETFNRCLDSGDSLVQHILLEKVSLSQEQLHMLAEQGATRAIRNRAAEKTRRRKKATS